MYDHVNYMLKLSTLLCNSPVNPNFKKTNKMFHFKKLITSVFPQRQTFRLILEVCFLTQNIFISNNGNFFNTGPMMPTSTPHLCRCCGASRVSPQPNQPSQPAKSGVTIHLSGLVHLFEFIVLCLLLLYPRLANDIISIGNVYFFIGDQYQRYNNKLFQ